MQNFESCLIKQYVQGATVVVDPCKDITLGNAVTIVYNGTEPLTTKTAAESMDDFLARTKKLIDFAKFRGGKPSPANCCQKIHAFYPDKPEYSGIFEKQPRSNDLKGYGDIIYKKVANAYTNSSLPSVINAKAKAGALTSPKENATFIYVKLDDGARNGRWCVGPDPAQNCFDDAVLSVW